MNIKNIYRVLNNELPRLKFSISSYTDKDYDYIFGEVTKFISAVNNVKRVAPFLLSSEIEKALSVILKGDTGYGIVSTKKNIGDAAIDASKRLNVSVNDYLNYLKPIAESDESENAIDVLLIHIESLEDLEKTASLLKRAFNSPAFEVGGQVTIGKVESGSIWINLLIGGTVASTLMRLCANMIWAAVAIKNKIKEAEYHEEYLRTIKIKNDFLEGVSNYHLEYIKQVKEAEAQHIINEFMAGKNTPDLNEHIKGSIGAIGELIDKGAEFYPSIKSSEEVKMLFPDFSIKELLESKIKLLSEGKEEKQQ